MLHIPEQSFSEQQQQHPFNCLFFHDSLGKLAPEKKINHSVQ